MAVKITEMNIPISYSLNVNQKNNNSLQLHLFMIIA